MCITFGQFCQRLQREVAQMQARVRNLQVAGLKNHRVIQQNVDVDGAGGQHIFIFPSQLFLRFLQSPHQLKRRQRRPYFQCPVQVARFVLHAPRRCFIHPGSRRHLAGIAPNQVLRQQQIPQPVPFVGAE